MRDALKRRVEALERRQGANDNGYRVTMVFDGDPEPAYPAGSKVVRLDFAN
jgi:hypothetical protein